MNNDHLTALSLNLVFEQWAEGLLIVDAESHILAINQQAKKLLAYDEHELINTQLHSALCSQANDYQHKEEMCLFNDIQSSFANQAIIDAWFIQKNGVYLHVDVKCMAQLAKKDIFSCAENKEPLDETICFVLTFQPCSIRRYSEKKLQRLALFAELNPSPIIEFNEQALIYFSNPAMIKLIADLGFNINGMPKVLPHNIQSLIQQCLSNGQMMDSIEVAVEDKWFLWNLYPVIEHSLVQAYGIDISARKKAEEYLFSEKERFLVTLNSINDAVITVDTNEIITYINPKAIELTGFNISQALGQTLNSIVHLFNSDNRGPLNNIVASSIVENRVYRQSSSLFLAHKEGYVIPVKQMVSPMCNRLHQVIGATIALYDISDTQRMEQSLSYQSTHDSLTQLINRNEFEKRLNQSIGRSKSDKIVHALLFMDLDNFKIINDTCGHTAGDQLLKKVSKLLRKKLRRGDTLARLGGDEFASILEGCPIHLASNIAKEICQEIQQTQFVWEAQSFTVGISIGLVPIHEDCEDANQLLSIADSSCYAAKDLGRNRVHVYQEDDVDFLKKQGEMQWVSRINKAINEDRFVLYFQLIQPINSDEQGLHFEVLLRMQDEFGNIIAPGLFLPAAEHYDLIKILDHWVVRNVFSWLNEHPDITKNISLCSINLSGNSIGDEHFMLHLTEQFESCHFSANKICFEVTETAAISNLHAASVFIDRIKSLGCSFSLDDFGSGMSSFGYLKQLNLDYLKIDGLFVKDIVVDPVDAAMVKSINEVGQIMGLKTIAEYVENDEILAVLKDIGVNFAQGYGICHPRPLDEIVQISESVKLK